MAKFMYLLTTDTYKDGAASFESGRPELVAAAAEVGVALKGHKAWETKSGIGLHLLRVEGSEIEMLLFAACLEGVFSRSKTGISNEKLTIEPVAENEWAFEIVSMAEMTQVVERTAGSPSTATPH